MAKTASDNSQSAVNFLLAAKEAETRSLSNLSNTCRVLQAIGDMIHDLQRERGLTNVYLASGGERLMQQKRVDQLSLSQQTEARLRKLFDAELLPMAEAQAQPSARLLNSVAYVLQGLSELAYLRGQIDKESVDATVMTQALSRLIAGLLEVVSEAADSSGDPAVSRALVAMINFMQGKEYAGQERAWGAIGFARGHFDEPLRHRLEHLQSCQEQASLLFEQFAEPGVISQWQQLAQQDYSGELTRLRGVIAFLQDRDQVAPELSEIWYSVTTARIDAMHDIEVGIINDVVRLSQERSVSAQSDYEQQVQSVAQLPAAKNQLSRLMLLENNAAEFSANGPEGLWTTDGEPSPGLRSIYDLIREQNERLAQVKAELDDTKRALAERKLVEQAKGLLMKSLKLNEEQAYRRIQQRAMESNLRLAEVSQMLIDTARSAGRQR